MAEQAVVEDETDVLAAADALAPDVAARAGEIEQNRFLPQDIAKQFAAAGFYRLCVPQAYGGLEAPPATLIRVIERLARADGSAAWCAFIGATSGAVAAFLPPDAAREVFGDPMTITAGVFAPRGKAKRESRDGVDGYVVDGRWQWGSGSRNAHWIMGGSLICDADGKPETDEAGRPFNRMMIARASEVSLLDTWDVSGLCGTGSTDFEFRDMFVPHARSVDLVRDTALVRPLYAFPTFGLLALGIAGVSLGLARAAIDDLLGLAGGKTPQGSQKPLALRATAQTDVAEAEAVLRSARAFLFEAVEEAWEAASATGEITVDHRRDVRLACTHAARSGARAVDLMYTLAGGTSVYRTSPLQRIFRDAHVATQHMMVAAPTLELAGRLFLDVPTDTALL